MKFEEAIKLLKEGKKVTREGGHRYLVLEGGHIQWDDGDNFGANAINWFTDDDWEEYKEDWKLEKHNKDGIYYCDWVKFEDVEKLKEKILMDCKNKSRQNSFTLLLSDVEEIINKRFGK